MDKRRILETFVENDEALGQLLDFISTRSENLPQNEIQPQNPLMAIVDKQGNRLQALKNAF